MHTNATFLTMNFKKSEERAHPIHRPLPNGEGDIPSPRPSPSYLRPLALDSRPLSLSPEYATGVSFELGVETEFMLRLWPDIAYSFSR